MRWWTRRRGRGREKKGEGEPWGFFDWPEIVDLTRQLDDNKMGCKGYVDKGEGVGRGRGRALVAL